jgi:hypothetical protein
MHVMGVAPLQQEYLLAIPGMDVSQIKQVNYKVIYN